MYCRFARLYMFMTSSFIAGFYRILYVDEHYDYALVYACLGMHKHADPEADDACKPGMSRLGFLSRTTSLPNSVVREKLEAVDMDCLTEDVIDWNAHSR